MITLKYNTISLKKGDTFTIEANYTKDWYDSDEILYKSSDESIVTVNTSGTIKGIKNGKATITAYDEQGTKSATCKVAVGSKSEVTVKTKTVDETYDALNDSGEHPKMHFIIKAKKGTYKNYIIIPSNTTLDLTGSKVKPPHFTHCLLSFGDSNNKKYNGGSNMTLIGGTFDGGTSSYIPNLCTFAHVKKVTIQKCYFKGFRYGCGSNHLHKKDHFKEMKFIGNTFVGASKYCICLYGYRNATIRGNKMKNCGSLVQNQNSTYHK